MYSEGFGLEVVEIEVHHRFWQGFFTAQIYINYVYNIFLWGFGGGGVGGTQWIFGWGCATATLTHTRFSSMIPSGFVPVMESLVEFCNFVFQAWRVMDFYCGSWKVI